MKLDISVARELERCQEPVLDLIKRQINRKTSVIAIAEDHSSSSGHRFVRELLDPLCQAKLCYLCLWMPPAHLKSLDVYLKTGKQESFDYFMEDVLGPEEFLRVYEMKSRLDHIDTIQSRRFRTGYFDIFREVKRRGIVPYLVDVASDPSFDLEVGDKLSKILPVLRMPPKDRKSILYAPDICAFSKDYEKKVGAGSIYTVVHFGGDEGEKLHAEVSATLSGVAWKTSTSAIDLKHNKTLKNRLQEQEEPIRTLADYDALVYSPPNRSMTDFDTLVHRPSNN